MLIFHCNVSSLVLEQLDYFSPREKQILPNLFRSKWRSIFLRAFFFLALSFPGLGLGWVFPVFPWSTWKGGNLWFVERCLRRIRFARTWWDHAFAVGCRLERKRMEHRGRFWTHIFGKGARPFFLFLFWGGTWEVYTFFLEISPIEISPRSVLSCIFFLGGGQECWTVICLCSMFQDFRPLCEWTRTNAKKGKRRRKTKPHKWQLWLHWQLQEKMNW